MVFLDPIKDLYLFFSCGLIVTISAASQHILLLTYQIETLHSREWGMGEAMSVFAYRMAILTGGAGALYLATFLSWKEVYLFLTFLMSIGLITVLFMKEPDKFSLEHVQSFPHFKDGIRYALIGPFKDFIKQRGWFFILLFMILYRLPENLLGMMQTLFLLDLGFTYIEIGNVAKVFGLGATILGGFTGGYSIRTYGYKKTLFWAALAHGVSCILFLIQQKLGANMPFLYITMGTEHFFSGIALTAFFSYQLTCCSVTFAATHLALLTSLADLGRALSPLIAGFFIDEYGWSFYLNLVILSSLPGILWVYLIPYSRP